MSNIDKLLYIDGLGEITQNLNIGGNLNVTETLFTNKLGINTTTVNTTDVVNINGNITIDGDIIPLVHNVHSLGSSSNAFKDVYVGPGSLYINNKKVLEDNSGIITLRTDDNQNLQLLTSGSGDIKLTSSNDIELNAQGNGNIVLTKSTPGDISITNSDTNSTSTIDITSSGGGINLSSGSGVEIDNELKVDTINERTSNTGVTIDSVLIKNNNVTAHTITAQNYAVGSTNFISASRQGNFRDVEVKNTNNSDTILLTGDGGHISLEGNLSVDTINEKTSNNGVTIDSVILKDNNITAHTITAQNYAVGSTNFISASRQGNFRDVEVKNSNNSDTILLTGDGGHISLEGTLSVDNINEKTSGSGVTINSISTINNNLTVNGIVNISGELNFTGTSAKINSTTIEVEDSLIKLASNNTANVVDIGIYGKYSSNYYAGLFKDNDNKWKLFTGLTEEPTSTVNINGSGYTVGTLVSNLEGEAQTVTNGVYTTNKLNVLSSTTSSELASIITDETGSGNLVFSNSPTLTSPALGTPASGILTNCTGTASGLTAGSVTNGVYITNKLNVLSSTTSSELASIITDETGSGNLVFSNSPTLTSPTINGILSINKESTNNTRINNSSGDLIFDTNTQHIFDVQGSGIVRMLSNKFGVYNGSNENAFITNNGIANFKNTNIDGELTITDNSNFGKVSVTSNEIIIGKDSSTCIKIRTDSNYTRIMREGTECLAIHKTQTWINTDNVYITGSLFVGGNQITGSSSGGGGSSYWSLNGNKLETSSAVKSIRVDGYGYFTGGEIDFNTFRDTSGVALGGYGDYTDNYATIQIITRNDGGGWIDWKDNTGNSDFDGRIRFRKTEGFQYVTQSNLPHRFYINDYNTNVMDLSSSRVDIRKNTYITGTLGYSAGGETPVNNVIGSSPSADYIIKHPFIPSDGNTYNFGFSCKLSTNRTHSTNPGYYNWGMPVIKSDYVAIYFEVDGYYAANIRKTWQGELNFTGQHRSKIINIDEDNIDNYIGLIVVSTGDYNNLEDDLTEFKPTINESLPIVELSEKKKDKSVFGVLSNIEDKNSENREYSVGNFVSVYPKKENDNRIFVNSVGEGAIWVVNTNGNLENGDYIQSSDIVGYGEKQDSEFLANYTVAKITCNCNFDLNSSKYDCFEINNNGTIYRKAFVGCTYHCG